MTRSVYKNVQTSRLKIMQTIKQQTLIKTMNWQYQNDLEQEELYLPKKKSTKKQYHPHPHQPQPQSQQQQYDEQVADQLLINRHIQNIKMQIQHSNKNKHTKKKKSLHTKNNLIQQQLSQNNQKNKLNKKKQSQKFVQKQKQRAKQHVSNHKSFKNLNSQAYYQHEKNQISEEQQKQKDQDNKTIDEQYQEYIVQEHGYGQRGYHQSEYDDQPLKMNKKQKQSKSSKNHNKNVLTYEENKMARQSWKSQIKRFNYSLIFEQQSNNVNHNQTIQAANQCKNILDEIVLYLITKELQIQIIVKSLSQLPQGNQSNQEKSKMGKKTQEQLGAYQIKKQYEKYLDNLETQSEQHKEFMNQFNRFKKAFCVTSSSIISMIPYKTIPTLMIVPYLNFIITKTTYTQKDNRKLPKQLRQIYNELNRIAIESKKYLIEEKIKKGLRNIIKVTNELNKVYGKDLLQTPEEQILVKKQHFDQNKSTKKQSDQFPLQSQSQLNNKTI